MPSPIAHRTACAHRTASPITLHRTALPIAHRTTLPIALHYPSHCIALHYPSPIALHYPSRPLPEHVLQYAADAVKLLPSLHQAMRVEAGKKKMLFDIYTCSSNPKELETHRAIVAARLSSSTIDSAVHLGFCCVPWILLCTMDSAALPMGAER
jgi:hypothetical protein